MLDEQDQDYEPLVDLDDGDDATPTKDSGKGRKKKKRVDPYNFSEEQEIDIGEWYRENECMYDRSNSNYRKTSHKRTLIRKKAATFDPPCSREYNYKMQ